MAISMLKDGKITPLEEERGAEAANQVRERGDASPRTEQEGEEQLQDAAAGEADVLEEAEGFSGKERAANRPGTEKRDWVEEAWKLFIKDAGDIDPTDPVKAIDAYFQKNATDELKARCKAEGKDAKGCWKFIEAVARKALGGRCGHIDPGVVYAIAMHWFEDVPKDWDKRAEARRSDMGMPKKPTTKKERLEERVAHGSSKAKAELRELKKKERAKAAKAARPDTRKKKPKQQQGFFFEMLETPATAPEAAASGTEQESEVKG